jgi:putative FmdB family regulatory protein
MPIYEYRCEPCDHAFETLIRNSGDVAHCPRCGSIEVAKQFSVPAAAQSGRANGSSLPICGDGGGSPSAFGCGGGRCATGMCSMD